MKTYDFLRKIDENAMYRAIPTKEIEELYLEGKISDKKMEQLVSEGVIDEGLWNRIKAGANKVYQGAKAGLSNIATNVKAGFQQAGNVAQAVGNVAKNVGNAAMGTGQQGTNVAQQFQQGQQNIQQQQQDATKDVATVQSRAVLASLQKSLGKSLADSLNDLNIMYKGQYPRTVKEVVDKITALQTSMANSQQAQVSAMNQGKASGRMTTPAAQPATATAKPIVGTQQNPQG